MPFTSPLLPNCLPPHSSSQKDDIKHRSWSCTTIALRRRHPPLRNRGRCWGGARVPRSRQSVLPLPRARHWEGRESSTWPRARHWEGRESSTWGARMARHS
ncbi:unnamed protein product [Ectocarpus fasciculatus]